MIQNKEVLEQIREEAVKELNSYDCRILIREIITWNKKRQK